MCTSPHICNDTQTFGGLQTPFPGGMTPGSATPSADLDLIKIGEARKSLVGVKLDQVFLDSHPGDQKLLVLSERSTFKNEAGR